MENETDYEEGFQAAIDQVYLNTARLIWWEKHFLFAEAASAFLLFVFFVGWCLSVGRQGAAIFCASSCVLILGALRIRLRSDANLLRAIRSCGKDRP